MFSQQSYLTQIRKTIFTSSVILTGSQIAVFIYGKKSDLRNRNSWDRIRSENIYKTHNEFILPGYRNRHSCYFRQKWLHDYMRNIWHLSVASIYSQVRICFPPVLQGERSDHLISPSEHYEYKALHKMFHCI